jgi:uncharacterized protein GlcG (DUF336 family)
MTVVDTNAQILGVIRTPDAPVFGTDVSVQKARSALLFSSSAAAALLNAQGSPISGYVTNMQGLIPGALTTAATFVFHALQLN